MNVKIKLIKVFIMKKNAVVIALLSAGLMSQAVNAAPSKSILEWTGFVGGAFAGTDVGITGLGGGRIQPGTLDEIDKETGAFKSTRPIVVEAHAIDQADTAPVISADMYEGDVTWRVSAPSISHMAYIKSKVDVTINGEPIGHGQTVTTIAGDNSVAFDVSVASASDPSKLRIGDAVKVTTLVIAEPAVI